MTAKFKSKTVDIAGSAVALTVVMQVVTSVWPSVHPMLVAALASMFFALKGYGLSFWKTPVDWILTATLILGSSNGATNLLANGQESLTPMASAAPIISSVESVGDYDYVRVADLDEPLAVLDDQGYVEEQLEEWDYHANRSFSIKRW